MKHSLTKFQKVSIILAAIAMLSVPKLMGQDEPRTSDKPGCSDYENISRYKGAVIQNCFVSDFEKYVLGLASPAEKSVRGHGKYFSSYLDIEGKVIRIQYLLDVNEGLDKVFANYSEALSGAGYKILCSIKDETWPFFNEDYYGGDSPVDDIRKFGFYLPSGSKGYYYITAQGINREQDDVYLSLFISYGNNNGQDFILVTEEIIEVNPVETGLVKAQNIDKLLEINGHVSIYGINFETGKYAILPGSEPQMEEIAAFLNSHKDQKFMIVGHTDNAGNFSANMELSKNRAAEVKKVLLSVYGVDENQVTDYGVANLAPLTSNRTDKGKARNRRVEIVEQ